MEYSSGIYASQKDFSHFTTGECSWHLPTNHGSKTLTMTEHSYHTPLCAKPLGITWNSRAWGRGFLNEKTRFSPSTDRESIPTCQPPFPQGFSLCCSVPISQKEKATEQHYRRMPCRSCLSSWSGSGLWWMWHTNLKQKLWLSDKLRGLVEGCEQEQPVAAEISSRAVTAPWNKSGSSIRASTKIKPDTPIS